MVARSGSCFWAIVLGGRNCGTVDGRLAILDDSVAVLGVFVEAGTVKALLGKLKISGELIICGSVFWPVDGLICKQSSPTSSSKMILTSELSEPHSKSSCGGRSLLGWLCVESCGGLGWNCKSSGSFWIVGSIG